MQQRTEESGRKTMKTLKQFFNNATPPRRPKSHDVGSLEQIFDFTYGTKYGNHGTSPLLPGVPVYKQVFHSRFTARDRSITIPAIPRRRKVVPQGHDDPFYTLKNFSQMELLGDGHMARVYRVRNKLTCEDYALKVQRKFDVIQFKQVEHVRNEREILSQMHHPFIVQQIRTYVDKRNVYILQELCETEFFTVLRSFGSFDMWRTKIYAAEIFLALEYLHSHKIVYRDLKPENLLFGGDGHIKICDFGFAKRVMDRTWTTCGTPDYLAPEIVLGVGHCHAVDWWSFGVLLYEMIAGYPPFISESTFEIYQQICDLEFKFTSPNFDDISKDIISKLLVEQHHRLGNLAKGSQDIKNHTFFSDIEWDKLSKKEIEAPEIPYLGFLPKPEQVMDGLDDIDIEEEDFVDAYEPIFRSFDHTLNL